MEASKSKRGGVRPGAGRPRTQDTYARPIAAALKKMAAKLPDVAEAMLELALGVWVEETDEEGEKRVYQRPPNFKAGIYVLDRVIGRVREESEPESPPPPAPAFALSQLDAEELDALKRLLAKAAPADGG